MALLSSGVLTGALAIVKDADTAGQFLTGFFGGFIVALVIGLWYRKGKHGPELFRDSIRAQPRTSALT